MAAQQQKQRQLLFMIYLSVFCRVRTPVEAVCIVLGSTLTPARLARSLLITMLSCLPPEDGNNQACAEIPDVPATGLILEAVVDGVAEGMELKILSWRRTLGVDRSPGFPRTKARRRARQAKSVGASTCDS